MPALRRYKVTQTQEVEVTVCTNESEVLEAVRQAEAVFMNPSQGAHSFRHSQVTVTETKAVRLG